MRKIIFYSWQSDLPDPTNRGFIQKALENAASTIVGDNTVSVEPVVDRDTQGVAGAPDIASTIFAKITAADVFVADVSIINASGKDRSTPNPNVLIELGYALKGLGHERVILVFNSSFGDIKNLPFDLRTRRIVLYKMPPEQKNRTDERKKLEIQLESAIRTVLENLHITEDTPVIPAITAIENGQANKVVVLRRNLGRILSKLDSLHPKKHSEGGTVDDLITAIDQTQEPIAEFSKITEIISIMNDQVCALEVYRWLGDIFERYDFPKEHSGRYSNADCDYFKFVGHELFVTFFAFLIREQRWDKIKILLNEAIPVKYLRHENGPGNVYWEYASEHLNLLLDESNKKGRISLHADILRDRHQKGGLAGILPSDEFMAADFFLFLFGELPPEENEKGLFAWRPWSVLYMKQAPMFIQNAERLSVAKQIAQIFNITNIDEFKKRLIERTFKIERLFKDGFWHFPIKEETIKHIGSRQ